MPISGVIVATIRIVILVACGAADVVKQFRDLKISGLIGLGGSILDALARGLQGRFFDRACNVQLDRGHDLGVQRHEDVMQTKILDRTGQGNLLALDGKAILGRGC